MLERIKAIAKHPLGWLLIVFLVGVLGVLLGLYETALYGFGHLSHFIQQSSDNTAFILIALVAIAISLVTGPLYVLWKRRDDEP